MAPGPHWHTVPPRLSPNREKEKDEILRPWVKALYSQAVAQESGEGIFHNPKQRGASLQHHDPSAAQRLQAKSCLVQPALGIMTAGSCLLSYRKHPPIHRQKCSLGWEHRQRWAEHGINRTSSLDKSYPLSMVQTHQGSTRARLGQVFAKKPEQPSHVHFSPACSQKNIAHQRRHSRQSAVRCAGDGQAKNPLH